MDPDELIKRVQLLPEELEELRGLEPFASNGPTWRELTD